MSTAPRRAADDVGYIRLTPGVLLAQGAVVLSSVVLGVVLTILLWTPRAGGPADAGSGQVASLSTGEEAKRKGKPRPKPKEPPPDPPPDDAPPKRPKQPTVTGEAERMAGEPEIETCGPGDGREEGCGP